jgi:uncharacterized protein YkwD
MSAACRLLASAFAAALLVAPATAHAQSAPAKGRKAAATIALGDKRAPKAKTAQVVCAHTDELPTAQNVDLIRAAVLCLHNQIRARRGLPLLKDNAKLRKAANQHSSEMVEQGYFDHTSPSGTTFIDRVLGAGYAKRNDAFGAAQAVRASVVGRRAAGLRLWRFDAAGRSARGESRVADRPQRGQPRLRRVG